MTQFKSLMEGKNEAFGVPLAKAASIERRRTISETIMKARDFAQKAKYYACKKHYLIPESYKEVQWEVFHNSCSYVFRPSTCVVTGAILFIGYSTWAAFTGNADRFVTGAADLTIWYSIGAINLYLGSRRLLKEKQTTM